MPGSKILIVEDDAALLEGLRDILEFSGYQIITARNGEEGLQALEAGPLPELVISDIMMPRMDGYAFYTAVRNHAEWVNVPFIFLTAKGEKTDVHRGKLMGADDYLIKPFDEEDLHVAIRDKLKRRSQLENARTTEIADLKRTILTTLNHEFRTPLTYISTYTEFLSESGPGLDSTEFKNFMDGIRLGSDRLRKLVEDFILLVEIQTGESRKLYERRRMPLTDLAMIVQKVLDDHAARAAELLISLQSEIPTQLPSVVADREFLLNALARLVDNALKFSKKGSGQVTVKVMSDDQHLYIHVVDTGRGIRPEAQKQLFDVFHQIDRATQEQQGSGSGLAIARGLIALHGGDLTVQSEYGIGSTFMIELPVQA